MNSHQNAHQELALQTVTVPDLNVTLEATRLICSVYQAVQQVTWRRGAPAPDADPTPYAILQSLLTYSYAVGNVCSDDIEAASIHDPAARYLCANHTPRSETIREFRRHNSASVTAALANLFKTITAAAPETYSAYSFARSFSSNRNFHFLAQQRLARAIQADSHALDI
jgi:hypothetical protein